MAHMNVLVVLLPRLRLHHLGCYGNEWVATPALDRLAAQGVVFDHHYAEIPGASQPFWPEWTGHRHSVSRVSAFHEPRLQECQLRRMLEQHSQAFAIVDSVIAQTEHPESPREATFERVLKRIQEMPGDNPWCVWAEFPDLAPPWLLPSEILTAYFDEEEEPLPWSGEPCGWLGDDEAEFLRLHQTYAAVVTHVDGAWEGFLDQLSSLTSFADTLLIITSDRGLALGEHGIVGEFRPWLHDELVHLPLIMRWPEAAEAGRRVSGLTQSVDLYATILDALGLADTSTEGRSLLPPARGEKAPEREFVISSLRLGEAEEWALRTREWAYLLPVRVPPGDATRRPQLYAKPEDPWEVNDVRDRHLELAEVLEQRLRSRIEAIAQGGIYEHREASG
jgi:arylsulfatase A-like enzyme